MSCRKEPSPPNAGPGAATPAASPTQNCQSCKHHFADDRYLPSKPRADQDRRRRRGGPHGESGACDLDDHEWERHYQSEFRQQFYGQVHCE